jgi:short-subunit dehydrogenase
MMARGRGAVVNVSSLAAEFPLPGMAAYTAAKGGLSGFSRALMMEAGAIRGVQVVDLQPGDYRTNFNRAMPRMEDGAAWEAPVRERLDALIEESPEVERAAEDLRRALAGGRSGTVVTGSFLQARLAPLAQGIFGHRILRWVMRHYFRLNRK